MKWKIHLQIPTRWHFVLKKFGYFGNFHWLFKAKFILIEGESIFIEAQQWYYLTHILVAPDKTLSMG